MKQIDYHIIRKQRRFKALSIDKEDILNVICENSRKYPDIFRIRIIDLPEQFFIEKVFWDDCRDSFIFIIGSPAFPSVPLSQKIPQFEHQFKMKTIEFFSDRKYRIL